MEYNAWGNPPNPPEHEANLVFTRMLAGPMDFTPGVLSLAGKGGQRIQSTIAKQLANYVVLYSPIQMAADLPENYDKYPKAFQFIKDVPTDWADTRVLNGEVGDFVDHRAQGSGQRRLVSRQRHRRAGAHRCEMTSGLSRRGTPLHGADLSRRRRRGLADQPACHRDRDARGQARRSLTLRLAPGGGQAIRFVATRGADRNRQLQTPARRQYVSTWGNAK